MTTTALFTQMLTDVYAITNRPDRPVETAVAVKNATLKAHTMDYFTRDIYELTFFFASSEYTHDLDYKGLVPRFRNLKYLYRTDTSQTPAVNVGDPLTIITPENKLDSYGQNKTNVVYLAGDVLQIKTECQWQYFTMGCYRYPNLTEATYDSWIAQEISQAITAEAARAVFKFIGKDEEAQSMKELIADAYALVTRTAVEAHGS
jgi:hypothetical protein